VIRRSFDVRDIAQAKAEQRVALVRALAGMARDPAQQEEPEPHEPQPRMPSLDGGARQSVPPPAPTHEQTLVAILAERRAPSAGRTSGARSATEPAVAGGSGSPCGSARSERRSAAVPGSRTKPLPAALPVSDEDGKAWLSCPRQPTPRRRGELRLPASPPGVPPNTPLRRARCVSRAPRDARRRRLYARHAAAASRGWPARETGDLAFGSPPCRRRHGYCTPEPAVQVRGSTSVACRLAERHARLGQKSPSGSISESRPVLRGVGTLVRPDQGNASRRPQAEGFAGADAVSWGIPGRPSAHADDGLGRISTSCVRLSEAGPAFAAGRWLACPRVET
jgi:hypothetical protein